MEFVAICQNVHYLYILVKKSITIYWKTGPTEKIPYPEDPATVESLSQIVNRVLQLKCSGLRSLGLGPL